MSAFPYSELSAPDRSFPILFSIWKYEYGLIGDRFQFVFRPYRSVFRCRQSDVPSVSIAVLNAAVNSPNAPAQLGFLPPETWHADEIYPR